MAASVAAAVTAAVVGSRLGVAGTVIGAGLASVISVVGGAIFGHSILFTRKQVKRAVLQVRGTGAGIVPPPTAVMPTPEDDRTVVIPRAVIPAVSSVTSAALGSRPGPERAEPGRPRPTRRRLGTGLVLAVTAAVAVFASSLGAVTLIEAIKGSPLAGGDSGGLSVLGGNGGTSVQETTDTSTPPAADPTTITQTVTSEVVSTATTTEPAPSSSAATPSGAEQSSTTTPTSPTSDPAPTTPSPSGAAGTGSAGVLSGSAGTGADPR